MQSWHRFIAALIAIAGIPAGCIIIPVPLPEDTVLAGNPVTPEQTAFIVPGVTTRAEVVERLGPPSILWDDARVIIYDWEMRAGVVILLAGGPGGGSVADLDISAHYLVIMEFDEEDRVLRFERTKHDSLQSFSEFLLAWKNAGPSAEVHAQVSPSESRP
jgi:hypothetical protein